MGEPGEQSKLLQKVKRPSFAEAVVRAKQQHDWAWQAHAELLDQPLTFVQYAGDCRTSPNSSWRSLVGDKYQVRLVLLAAAYAGFGLAQYAISNNVILFLSVRAGGNVGPSASETLPDVVHEMLAPLGLRDPGPARYLCDFIPYTLLPIGVGYMFFCGETRRIVTMAGVLLFLLLCNSVAGTVTIMPDAHKGGPARCFTKFDAAKQASFEQPGLWMLNILQGAFACNDMMWSGHTMQTSFGVLIFDRVLKQRHSAVLLRVCLYLMLVLYCFLLLGVRVHYASDVFIAVLLAVAFFHHAPFQEFVWSWSCFLVGLRADEDDEPRFEKEV